MRTLSISTIAVSRLNSRKTDIEFEVPAGLVQNFVAVAVTHHGVVDIVVFSKKLETQVINWA